MQLGVNHLGHFLLTNLLLDFLKQSAPNRIVVVSSKLYKYGSINFEDLNSEQNYNKAFCYSQSKLANLLFTRAGLALDGTGVTVNALTPGIVRTRLGRHVNIPLLIKPLFLLVSWLFFKSPLEGAQTPLYLACSPEVEGVSGKCFANCEEEHCCLKPPMTILLNGSGTSVKAWWGLEAEPLFTNVATANLEHQCIGFLGSVFGQVPEGLTG